MIADPTPVEDLLRDLAPQVIGSLTRQSGDFDAAEDAVQEALIAAADHWSRDGIPENPRAWLQRTAGRRLIDQRRSEQARANRELQVGLDTAVAAVGPGTMPDEDDTLAVLFMCCHPSLTPASAIALTLRAVGGLTTPQIARAFLVPEATMGQRISRAKRTITESGVPFRRPTADERPVAIRSVLHVLYLMFNEGYVTSDGADLGRPQLADEAIRLARMVRRQLPDDPEVAGPPRADAADRGPPAGPDHCGRRAHPAPDQDRTAWDHALVEEGTRDPRRRDCGGPRRRVPAPGVDRGRPRSRGTAEATDWRQILTLYELLERMTHNPVVTVNRAVAAAMVDGPAAGLTILDGLNGSVAGSHRVAAVRAHLLEMAATPTERSRAIGPPPA